VSLTQKIVLSMLLGFAVGTLLNLVMSGGIIAPTSVEAVRYYLIDGLFDTVGQIFVRSLKLMVVPLVFVSLLCGTASLGTDTKMGFLAGNL